MEQTQSSEGQVAPDEEEQSQGQEAPEGVPDPSVSRETSDHDFEAEAKDAFFKGHEEELETPESHLGAGEKSEEEKKPEEKPEKKPDDTPVTELDVKYSLDDLKLPHKYKGGVEGKINAILAEAKTQAGKLTEGYSASNAALARAFADIVNSDDPMGTLRGYAEEAAPVFGFSKELLQNLGKNGNARAGQEGVAAEGSQVPVDIQARLNQELSRIEDEYWPLLEQEQDPKRAREIFSQMERKKLGLVDAVNNAKQKAVLMAFYNKLIKPRFEEYSSLKERAEAHEAVAARTQKISMWNKADADLSNKYKDDWQRYRPKVKELLKSDEFYLELKNKANASGKGHQKVMEDLYLLISRQDHMAAAKRPQFGTPGVKPQGKHVQTQPAGGMTEAEIKRRYWSDIIPADAL